MISEGHQRVRDRGGDRSEPCRDAERLSQERSSNVVGRKRNDGREKENDRRKVFSSGWMSDLKGKKISKPARRKSLPKREKREVRMEETERMRQRKRGITATPISTISGPKR